ncbi:MAG: transcriptional regulator [Gemmatimonadetes bacterium]|nr:transcriptional regulator [Gemmatimonadota bacterium]
MVITEIKLIVQQDGALRAYATITFNDCFVVHGVKVIEGAKGRFVAMPSRKRRDGSHQDVAHPITKDFRGYLEATVLQAYCAEVGEEMELEREAAE